MDTEIFKSYLIKLGVQIDTAAFDKMKDLLKDLEKVMGNSVSSQALKMTTGAGLIVGAYATIMTAITKTISKVAEADMSYQLLAQRMYMSVEAAKAYKQATDTLGYSIDQIAWNAELQSKYLILVKQINDLKLPPEAADMFKQVRGIGFEFDRLKLLSEQTLERVAYNLLRLNKGELYNLRKGFNDWVEDAITKVPEVAEKIANFLQPFVEIGKNIFQLFESVVGFIKDIGIGLEPVVTKIGELWNKLSGVHKQALLLGGAFAILMKGSPLFSGISALGLALIGIDDLMAFKNGRESMEALIWVWKGLYKIANGYALLMISIATTWDHIRDKIAGKETGSLMDKLQANWSATIKEQEKFMKDRDVSADYNRRVREAKEKGEPLPAPPAEVDISSSWGGKGGMIPPTGSVYSEEKGEWISPSGAVAPSGAVGGKISGGKMTPPISLSRNILTEEQKNEVKKAHSRGLGAIAFIESSGRANEYTIHGQPTKYGLAYGRYQIMEKFWDSFAKRAGLPAGTPPTPDNQDYVASVNWNYYVDKYKSEELASIAWFSGESVADAVYSGKGGKSMSLSDPTGTTVARYRSNFIQARAKELAQRTASVPTPPSKGTASVPTPAQEPSAPVVPPTMERSTAGIPDFLAIPAASEKRRKVIPQVEAPTPADLFLEDVEKTSSVQDWKRWGKNIKGFGARSVKDFKRWGSAGADYLSGQGKEIQGIVGGSTPTEAQTINITINTDTKEPELLANMVQKAVAQAKNQKMNYVLNTVKP